VAFPASVMPAPNIVTAIVSSFFMRIFSHCREQSANRRSFLEELAGYSAN